MSQEDYSRLDKWDNRFINLCDHIANWSKDRSTKVGAVIVDSSNRILSVGYNGFPQGINDDIDSRHERPNKYLWTEHAERNAIYTASRLQVNLVGATLYCNYLPCPDCSRAIIQSGISRVVYKELHVNSGPSESTNISIEMLTEVDINLQQV